MCCLAIIWLLCMTMIDWKALYFSLINYDGMIQDNVRICCIIIIENNVGFYCLFLDC